MRVACYIRVSTDEQAKQDISIPMQKSRLLSYCEAKQWLVEDWYIDDGHSGKNLNRPELKRMLRNAEKANFDGILVWKLDRLSRRQQHIMYLIEDVFRCTDEKTTKTQIASVTENLDTTTPMGRMMIGVMAAFAQLERETIIERVRESKMTAAEQGRFMGGTTPYGYNYNLASKQLEIDPLQASVVRWIYNTYAGGSVGYQGIVDLLEEKKVPPPKAKHWNRTSVSQILSSPFYIGMIPHKGQMHQGKHEALIDRKLWDDVQALKKSRGGERPVPESSGYLSGIISCGECGAKMRYKMVPQKSGTISRYYACYSQEGSPRYLVKDPNCDCGYKHVADIDKNTVDQLLQISLNEEIYEEIAKEILRPSDLSKIESKLERAKKEHAGIQKKIDKWADAYEDDKIGLDEYHERTKQLKEKRQYLAAEIQACQDELDEAKDRLVSASDVLEALRNFAAVWEVATESERKAVITGLIKQVFVFKDGSIKIEYEV